MTIKCTQGLKVDGSGEETGRWLCPVRGESWSLRSCNRSVIHCCLQAAQWQRPKFTLQTGCRATPWLGCNLYPLSSSSTALTHCPAHIIQPTRKSSSTELGANVPQWNVTTWLLMSSHKLAVFMEHWWLQLLSFHCVHRVEDRSQAASVSAAGIQLQLSGSNLRLGRESFWNVKIFTITFSSWLLLRRSPAAARQRAYLATNLYMMHTTIYHQSHFKFLHHPPIFCCSPRAGLQSFGNHPAHIAHDPPLSRSHGWWAHIKMNPPHPYLLQNLEETNISNLNLCITHK